MIRAKGGEMVLTPGQQSALGSMMRPQSSGISEQSMSRAFKKALDDKLGSLGPDDIFALSQKGRGAF
jgi:hypothetical protein